jgi:hypothetical protein
MNPFKIVHRVGTSEEQRKVLRDQITAEQTEFYPPKVPPVEGDSDVHVTSAEDLAATIRTAEGYEDPAKDQG